MNWLGLLNPMKWVRSAAYSAVESKVDEVVTVENGKSLVIAGVNKDGNLCPRADDQVFFEVEGGRIVGVDNGNPISMERFKDTKRKAFNGKCLVVVATDGGDVTVRAKGYQLGGSEVMVKKSM